MMSKSRQHSPRTPAERLIRSLQEAVAIQQGDSSAARVTRRLITARACVAEPAPSYRARRVARLRRRLKVSQALFAQMLNVSAETVRAWEQGKNPPSGPAARLLELVGQHPDWFLRSIAVRSSFAAATRDVQFMADVTETTREFDPTSADGLRDD